MAADVNRGAGYVTAPHADHAGRTGRRSGGRRRRCGGGDRHRPLGGRRRWRCGRRRYRGRARHSWREGNRRGQFRRSNRHRHSNRRLGARRRTRGGAFRRLSHQLRTGAEPQRQGDHGRRTARRPAPAACSAAAPAHPVVDDRHRRSPRIMSREDYRPPAACGNAFGSVGSVEQGHDGVAQFTRAIRLVQHQPLQIAVAVGAHQIGESGGIEHG